MRATITVERQRASASAGFVAGDVVKMLESIPGITEIAVERQDTVRATISYRWKDPGIHTPGVSASLMAQGMRVV